MSDRITLCRESHRGRPAECICGLRRVAPHLSWRCPGTGLSREHLFLCGRDALPGSGAQGACFASCRAPPLQPPGLHPARTVPAQPTACSWTSVGNALGLLQRFVRSGIPSEGTAKGKRAQGFRPQDRRGQISADFPSAGPFATTSLWLATEGVRHDENGGKVLRLNSATGKLEAWPPIRCFRTSTVSLRN